ncbi:MAG: D-aminoacyl-tRNA deacylase [Candidatus Omnitrophica bacterium]|nr:D-aminoacyl-tRNA deacylase [Candidatus Omnitrophota bacterium]MCM8801737.1 D-aminoacyl-tRNA deacylase [Candidatus Omnitrophota bacterium]
MRVVIQRVKKAKLFIEDKEKGKIGKGLVVFLGIGVGDDESKIDYIIKKILSLRIFEDENRKMNYSVVDIGGDLMVVSQFTLYGDCKRGNRPDFTQAEKGEIAEKIYNKFIEKIKKSDIKIVEGEFGKKMCVEIHNDGPCTIILEK